MKEISAWERVQLARHPKRPHTSDYLENLFTDFVELHGDRIYGDDPAIISGFGKFEERPVVIIGHQKGKDTRENIKRNFGMAHPEGYGKALRLMKLGERFHLPLITLIDTPGAHPGLEAEERGQALAIAKNLEALSFLKVPIIVLVIGEGGSGGALGIGFGDRILMLENSIYSVISPEGCAAILWKDQSAMEKAAEVLKLTAPDLLKLGIVDEVIKEPKGGAHLRYKETFEEVRKSLNRHFDELSKSSLSQLLEERYKKLRKIGVYKEG